MANVVSFKRCRLVRHQTALFQRELPATRQASVVLDVKRAETAKECLQAFFNAISSLNSPADAVTIPGVGLRIDTFPSTYDLWYFTRSASLYAIDSRDKTLIYKSAS